jgi:hypothetical protein
MSDVYLGFDPGGDRNFGVALLCGAELKISHRRIGD